MLTESQKKLLEILMSPPKEGPGEEEVTIDFHDLYTLEVLGYVEVVNGNIKVLSKNVD